MKITNLEQGRRRKAISAVLGTIIMFSMIFTVGFGYILFVTNTSLQTQQANQQSEQAFQQAAQEKLSMVVGLSSATQRDPWGQTGDLTLKITNVGGSLVTVIDVFVTNTALDIIASHSQVTPGTPYLATKGSAIQKGDLNYSLPLTILPGFSTAQMSGCGATRGCGIAISYMSYSYGPVNPSPVVVSVLTSSGNVFSVQYPPAPGASTVSTTENSVTTITSTNGGANPGGSDLVVQMVATPPQTFGCVYPNVCVTDTVTVYNYGASAVTGISLSPPVPLVSLTGVATASSDGPCTLVGGNPNLSAYSGSGTPPDLVYVCTYNAQTNGYGGFASFMVQALGTLNGAPTTSGQAISNTIQIGGPIAVLNQGPFSANFFFFQYSACTTNSYPCTTIPNPLTFANLPTPGLLSGNSYYVAFYVNILNNFNVTLPILPYSFLFVDTTSGADSPFYLVGSSGNVPGNCAPPGYSPCNPSLPYLPTYNPGGSGHPTLTAYPTTCIATATASCIIIPPAYSAVLTFAACDISSTWWNWAGYTYDKYHDSGNTCTTNPANFAAGNNGISYLSIIVTFVYNGQVYAQQIPFEGLSVI